MTSYMRHFLLGVSQICFPMQCVWLFSAEDKAINIILHSFLRVEDENINQEI